MKKQLKFRVLPLFLVLVLMSTLTPFARAEEGDTPPPPPPTTNISLNLKTLPLRITETGTLISTVTPEGTPVTWVSDKPAIATVDAVGKVTAVAPGEATITATATNGDQSASDFCTVTVTDATVKVTLDRTELILDVNTKQTLAATVSMEPEVPAPPVTWTSNSSTVATVGSNGEITALSPGTATITATAGNSSASCKLTVPGISLSKPSLSLIVGNSETISKSLHGMISSTDFLWSSSNDTVAAVDNNGRVNAVSAGSAIITVQTYDGKYTASCPVTVTENAAGVIYASARAGQPLSLETLESQMNNRCHSMLGSSLSYVTNLSVSTQAGILYYGYASESDTGAGVGGSEKYDYNSSGGSLRKLSLVSFVPNSGFSGTATISYSGFNSSHQFFTGEIRVEVEESHDVNYTTTKGTAVTFRSEDFSAICRAQNGRDLSYVTFRTPSSRYGTLYYNYTGSGTYENLVKDDTQYYRTHSPYLDSVTFVPASDYTGTLRISYVGADTSGYTFSGRVSVTVNSSGNSNNGTLSYHTSSGSAVGFNATDFNTLCKKETGSYLNYVCFDLPSSSKGTLYYNYRNSGGYDSKVSSSTRYYRSESSYISNISFLPASSFSGSVDIPFTGWNLEGSRFSGTVTITVDGGNGDLSYRTNSNTAVSFNATDFNTACRDATGYQLNYILFDLPSSSKGTLYYNYRSSGSYDSKVSSSTRYYRNESSYISSISFLPASNFSGSVDISFTGWNVNGSRFSGTVTITVGSSNGNGALSYRTKSNTAVSFNDTDFNTLCKEVTGTYLDYVCFDLPSSSKGTLYYNYRNSGSYDNKVSSSTRYYRNSSSYLSNISFLPANNFSGSVDISFDGWTVSGSRFSGTVTITVGSNNGNGDLSYRTKSNTVVSFNDTDFNTLCKEVTGTSLDYVCFDLPSSSKGILYYNYRNSGSYDNKVSSSTRYYRNSSSYLSNISFLPANNFSGSVDISFDGWTVSGSRFSGTVTITVGSSNGNGDLSYRTKSNTAVSFNDADFNTFCKEVTGTSLNYVCFDLPSSSKGTLYYNYRNSGSYDNKVSSSTRYYRNSSSYLSNISFLPANNFSGSVDISFDGWTVSGSRFSGTVTITVGGYEADVIRYVTSNGSVSFQIQSFQSVCDNLQDTDLSRVKFELPPVIAGHLYYHNDGTSDTPVSSSVYYYRNQSPSLGQVRFVANAGYYGTVSIPYTAVDIRGDIYEGQVEITVPFSNTHFSDMGIYHWANSSVDYLYQKGVVQGISPTEYGPALSMTRADFVVMLCRAFQITPTGTTRFVDVPENSYYAAYIAAAEARGIVQGSGNLFSPTNALTREDAMVLLQRTMQVTGWSLPDGSYSRLVSFHDGDSVSPYAVGATAALVELGVIQGDTNSNLNPKGVLSRAEMAVILHRVLIL